MLADLQVDICGDAETEPVRIHDGGIPGKDAEPVQPLYSRVDAGSRDVQPLREGPHRQPPVRSQRLDDAAIDRIECRCHLSTRRGYCRASRSHMANCSGFRTPIVLQELKLLETWRDRTHNRLS